MTKKFEVMKVNPFFKQKLDEIARERVKAGKDKKTQSYNRLTLAIARHDRIVNDLARADFINDNKGQFSVFNIFTIIIVAFIAVMLFAGLIYVSGMLNTVFHQVGIDNEVNAGKAGYVNMTKAADDTFGKMNDSVQALRLVALTLVFSLLLGNILINAFVRVHPAFFFIYVLMVLLAVIFSAPISNSYLTIYESGAFGGLIPSFGGVNWIMLHLPIVVTVIGILGGIFMFINILRSGSEEMLR